jgi:hypothetical protein
MKNSSHPKERRKYPRIMMNFPLNFQINENRGAYPGLTIDASQSGLLIQTLKEMPVGIKLDIEVLLPQNLKLSKLRAETDEIFRAFNFLMRLTWFSLTVFSLSLSKCRVNPEPFDSAHSSVLSDIEGLSKPRPSGWGVEGLTFDSLDGI